MAMQMLCDLCGKPIIGSNRNPRCFKVKELTGLWHEQWWQCIDVHDECVRKLLNAVTIDGKPISTMLHQIHELVRCKDCKHWFCTNNGNHRCEILNKGQPNTDWFCADGEKRTD